MPNAPNEKYFEKVTKYHYYIFFLIYSTKFPIFWHVLSLIFLSPPMTYTCKGPSEGIGACPCDNIEWNRTVFTETMQTKFDMVCEKKWMVSFTQSMLYVGTLLGALSFGVLSDLYGRLSMFALSCFVISAAGSLLVLMPTAITYILMRCLEGVGVGGSIVVGYVYLVEFCGTKYREMVSALFHVPINISHASLAGISYLIRNCDDMQLALSLPTFLVCLIYWLGLESPKWLVSVEKYERATQVMMKIAKFNGESPEKMKTDMESYYSVATRPKVNKISFWQIFNHRRLTINLLCMSFIYFVCGMGYYGVSQYIGKMSGDIHKNVFISGVMLIPGTLTCSYLLTKLGRRTFLMATCFLSGTFMIIVITIPKHLGFLRVMMACICNTFFFMSFIIVFLYGVELFPTSIRNSVLGVLSVVSRVGQISAPPLNALPETLSGAIFGAMAIMGAVLCIPLPETKNVDLPTSLEDTKNIPRKITK